MTAAGRGNSMSTTTLRSSAFICGSLLATLLASPALADSVRLSGIWIDNVNIQSVTDGNLVYSASTGAQVVKPLAEIEGIRITAVPELEQAQAALAANNPREAVRLLREAARKARQEWASQYVQRTLIEALTAAGDAAEAARAFGEHVRADPEPFFVPAPPVEPVRAANQATKDRVAATVKPMLARTPERYRAAMTSLLEAAGGTIDTPAAPTPARPATPAPTGGAPAAPASPSAPVSVADSRVLLPVGVDENDPVVQMLRRGEFEPALAAVRTAMLSRDRTLSQPLYFQGLAQLGLADASGDEKLYKDAGLSFMRVIAYFGGRGNRSEGPALVEAGYVHQKLGRRDIADKLFERAQLLIDEEEDPAYYARLTSLMAASPAE